MVSACHSTVSVPKTVEKVEKVNPVIADILYQRGHFTPSKIYYIPEPTTIQSMLSSSHNYLALKRGYTLVCSVLAKPMKGTLSSPLIRSENIGMVLFANGKSNGFIALSQNSSLAKKCKEVGMLAPKKALF